MNLHVARHVPKNFLNDISQSRRYDNTSQRQRFIFTREEQKAHRSWTVIGFRAVLPTELFNVRRSQPLFFATVFTQSTCVAPVYLYCTPMLPLWLCPPGTHTTSNGISHRLPGMQAGVR